MVFRKVFGVNGPPLNRAICGMRDGFGRSITYLRLSVTDRCNLRCGYCMPKKGVKLLPKKEILSYGELETLCKLFVDMGIEKIRVTGGEPLLRRDILSLLERLSKIPGLKELCLTTNGVLLERFARDLRIAGVKRVNVSLDSLREEVFCSITSYPYLREVLRGISVAMDEGFVPLKVNTVMLKGVNHGELLDFVELAREKPINVRFIEYMPFGEYGNGSFFYSAKEAFETISQKYTLEPMRETDAPAVDYQIKGFVGWISFISPVSEPFCHKCNRIRLTASGALRLCLLNHSVLDLKTPLRRGASLEEIAGLIKKAVSNKPRRHGLKDDGRSQRLATMVRIGG